MKRLLSLTAFVLAVILLLSPLSACGKKTEKKPPEETAVTTVTAITTVGQTETEKPQETAAPVPPPDIPAEQCFTVWKSSLAESLLSGETEDAPLYKAREEQFRGSSGLAIKETEYENIQSAVRTGVLSGDTSDILLLNVRTDGAPLFCAGLLQDLSAAGIGITEESACTVPTLAEELYYDGHLFLLPYRGLCSTVSSVFAVSVKNKTDAQITIQRAFADSTYCLDTVLAYLKEWEETDPEYYALENEESSEEYLPYETPAIGGGSKALEGLLSGADGWVMVSGTVPTANILTEKFARAFTAVSATAVYLSDREENINVTVLSERNPEGRTLYPLPPVSSGGVYVTPLDEERLTVVAAPSGIVYGQRTAELLGLLSDLSGDLCRKAAEGEDLSAKTAELLFSTLHIELAKIYTWGDLYDLAFAKLGSAGYGALANADDLNTRIKVAESAAQIIRERIT